MRRRESFIGWLRQIGRHANGERKRTWTAVAEAPTEAACLRATDAARHAAPWSQAVLCEWTALRRGEHPTTALRRRLTRVSA